MFLWTMVVPLKAIEKDSQPKPCSAAPEIVAQGVPVFSTRPIVSAEVTLGGQGATDPRPATPVLVPRGCPALPVMACADVGHETAWT